MQMMNEWMDGTVLIVELNNLARCMLSGMSNMKETET
jgi:hypothetical protein